ncbi:MAG TPA: hypothetical protein VKX16_06765, partial [Chloroflexota bacterium]|nr:hypothetical protein [Chloroflexota bacterium]
QGTLSGTVLGPVLGRLAQLTSGQEMLLNLSFITVALAMAVGLLVVRPANSRPILAVSMAVSLLMWVATEACGQVLTGAATDLNSGPLLVLMALACWPVTKPASVFGRERRVVLEMEAIPAV